jgi:hypothetical protein
VFSIILNNYQAEASVMLCSKFWIILSRILTQRHKILILNYISKHKDLTSLNRNFATFITNQLNEFYDFAINKMNRINSFPPIVDKDSQILILGSVPVLSLWRCSNIMRIHRSVLENTISPF